MKDLHEECTSSSGNPPTNRFYLILKNGQQPWANTSEDTQTLTSLRKLLSLVVIRTSLREGAQPRSDQDVELEISVAAPACPPGWRRKGRQHDSEAYARELDPRCLWGAWNVAST